MPRPCKARPLAAFATLLLLLLPIGIAEAASPVVVAVPAASAAPTEAITLAEGEQATITADGTASCDSLFSETFLPCLERDATGAAPTTCTDLGLSACIAPDLPAFSLLARVNGRPWSYLGAGPTTFVGPGTVRLQYNDDDFTNNSGQLEATIVVSAASSARIVSITATPDPAGPRSQTIPRAGLSKTSPLGAATPSTLADAPLRSSPLRSSPLRSSPLRSSPLRSSPLRSSAIGPITLAQLPLRSSSWTELLTGTTLDVPVASLTLDQLFALDPLPAAIRDLTLADLDLARSPLRSSALGDLLLAGVPLTQLPPPNGEDDWCPFVTFPCPDPSTLTLADANVPDGYLGELDLADPALDLTGSILSTIALDDLDLSRTPLAGRTDLGSFDTIGELAEAMPLLGPPALPSLTLGALLPGLITPEQLPLELASIDDLLATAPRATTGLLRYRLTIDAPCDVTSLDLAATLPQRARYVAGSATAEVAEQSIPLTDPPGAVNAATIDLALLGALRSGCTGEPVRETLIVTFDAEPPARLGAPDITAILRADGASYARSGSGATVEDLNDPGESAASAGTLQTDELRTGYLPEGDAGDAYSFAAPPVGSTVTIVLSHLPADFDLSVTGAPIGVPSAPLRSSPLRSSPLRSSTITDDELTPTGTINPAALQDLPLRSSELESSPLRSSSISRGLTTESTTFTVTPEDAGKRFTIRVTPYDGATSNDPYVLRAEVSSSKAAPVCRAARTLPSAPKGDFPALPLPTSTKTLFLVNEQRLRQLYPSANITALRAKLDTLAARSEVQGVVVPVESDPSGKVAAAYADWDASPCSVGAINDVASAIRGVIGDLTQNTDGLRSIVLVGGDPVIPQVRVADLTGTANEREEADALTFGRKDASLSRSLRDGFLLTDDAYGDFDPEASPGGAMYVPDVALGRLVESPGEITEQLDLYAAANGSLSINSAHVSGYDFLKDGAEAILAQLSGLPSITTSSLINEDWTAAQARSAMNRPTPGITSVNGHYDHYRSMPAAAFNGLVPDLLGASEVTPAAGSLLFTAGCHAGLNVDAIDLPDATAADATRLRDWVQQVTSRAVYIANTTYGYGDTEVVAYSERLLELLAEGVASRAVTAGQALMLAKQRYAAELATPGVYDQKSSMGLTYYGLPFFTVGAGSEGASALPQAPQPGTEVRSDDFLIEPNLVKRFDTTPGSFGAWYTVDDEAPQATPGRPLQPRTTRDVTATDGLPVHGAVVESLLTGLDYITPVLADPVIDLSANEPSDRTRAEGIFPSWFVRTTRTATSGGLRDQLVLVAGQYDASQSQQTLVSRIGGKVLRSHSTDYDQPVIRSTDALLSPAGSEQQATFVVRTPARDVARGLVLYRDDSSSSIWKRLELTQSSPGVWTGTAGAIGAGQLALSYVVQLVDDAGNVGVSTNKGTDYRALPADRSRAPKLTLGAELPPSGFASGPVTVTLDPGTSSGATFVVSIDGADPQPYSGPFVVSGDGIHVVRFTGSDGTQGSLVVRIDTSAPAVAGTTMPLASPEGFVAGPATITWSCTDPVAGVSSCPPPTTIATEVAGATVSSGTATDRAENTGTGTAPNVNVDMNAPTVGVGAPSAALRSGGLIPATPLASAGTITGSAADSLAGIRSVQVTFTPTAPGGQPITVDAAVSCASTDRRSCTWTAPTPTTSGTWTVTAAATDRAGRTTAQADAGPITTTGPAGSTGSGAAGGSSTPPPTITLPRTCTSTVKVSVRVPVRRTIRGRRVVVWRTITRRITITVPCCPPGQITRERRACDARVAKIARRRALAKLRASLNLAPTPSTTSRSPRTR